MAEPGEKRQFAAQAVAFDSILELPCDSRISPKALQFPDMSDLSAISDLGSHERRKSSAEPHWRAELRSAIRDPYELCRKLKLPASLAEESAASTGGFPLLVTKSYLECMQPGDADDPLLRQVLPRRAELESVPGFVSDPLGEEAAQLQPGMLHKYHGRVLLVVTGACAIHCRYCFRRHYPYADSPKTITACEPAIAQIAEDQSISEVILSGGDPLTVVDSRLFQLAARLDEIPHLQRLRIHSRLPVVLPSRICTEFQNWFVGGRLRPIIVIHANHAAELSNEVGDALNKLSSRGVMLFNQAVLLKGVNDSVTAQRDLCERLLQLGVTPYYLHLLDRVTGAAHFDVPESQGRTIIDQLRSLLPGYAVPRLAREEPGAASKVVLR